MNLRRWFRLVPRLLLDICIFMAVILLSIPILSNEDDHITINKYEFIISLALIYALVNAVQSVYFVSFKHITGEIVLKLIFSGIITALFSQFFLIEPDLVYLFISLGIAFCILTITILTKYSYRIYNRIFKKKGKPVLVYGAGSAGRQFVNAIFQNQKYYVRGFIDDDVAKQGDTILGHHVFSPIRLKDLLKKRDIESVVIAMPSLSPDQLSEIYKKLKRLSVDVLTLPSFDELLSGKSALTDLMSISPEEVLNRGVVKPDKNLLSKTTSGKVVLITGAGGSIGSQISLLTAEQLPRKIILLDHSEYALYKIDSDLKKYCEEKKITLIPILGSVLDTSLLGDLFKQHNIETVFHAAAYKHVPLVEENIFSAVQNNIFGTQNLVHLAKKHKCKNFTLISTDKAVRPTNVMGATKRVAEIICQASAHPFDGKMSICMVRFGNVLGSSGSVIPLFNKQIKTGGPVTITHKDINRYFMTIREASELVIQASALASSGEVFILDMGKPVKIMDLAKRMIRLNGKIPVLKSAEVFAYPSLKSDEIMIIETGLRKGEKLYEELLVGGQSQSTIHPKIWIETESFMQYTELTKVLEQLELELKCRNWKGVINILKSMPIEFNHNT